MSDQLDGDFDPQGDLDEADPDQAPKDLDPDQAPDPDQEPDAVDGEADADDDEPTQPATVLPGGFINPDPDLQEDNGSGN